MAQVCAHKWKEEFSRLAAVDAGVYAAVLVLISERAGPIKIDYPAIAEVLHDLSAAEAEKSVNRLTERCLLFVTPERELMDWKSAEAMDWRALPFSLR